MLNDRARRAQGLTAGLSILLILFTLPHSFEDVEYEEPARFGLSQGAFSLGMAAACAAQGLALYWLGLARRIGLWSHLILGFGWGFAALIAHAPEALAKGQYRSGALSVADLVGIIAVRLSPAVVSALALRRQPGLLTDPESRPVQNRRMV